MVEGRGTMLRKRSSRRRASRRGGLLLLFAGAVVPSGAFAQAYRCAIPSNMPRVRAEPSSTRQARRILPVGGYTLALTWSPQYCREHAGDAATRFQCGDGNRFGFTLHGLWPDGAGKVWPQYCRATGPLPPSVIRANLCATPSTQLLQHEWTKHGTCLPGATPAEYFRRSGALYRGLRYPNMEALSRRRTTVGQFEAAMAAVNPGLRPDMMRVTADRRGWLDEVRICLDKQFRYRRCPSHQIGLAARTPLRIWRGPR